LISPWQKAEHFKKNHGQRLNIKTKGRLSFIERTIPQGKKIRLEKRKIHFKK